MQRAPFLLARFRPRIGKEDPDAVELAGREHPREAGQVRAQEDEILQVAFHRLFDRFIRLAEFPFEADEELIGIVLRHMDEALAMIAADLEMEPLVMARAEKLAPAAAMGFGIVAGEGRGRAVLRQLQILGRVDISRSAITLIIIQRIGALHGFLFA